jgi:hypothetical protein
VYHLALAIIYMNGKTYVEKEHINGEILKLSGAAMLAR